jgi:arsenate reductase
MTLRTIACLLLVGGAMSAPLHSIRADEATQAIETFLAQRAEEFAQISPDRQALLREAAAFVRAQRDAGRPARLTFICTHNSRRSQLAQVWATVAAVRYGAKYVDVYSGGTEATAFNPRAVAALERAGLSIDVDPGAGDAKNPRYAVSIPGTDKPLVCFSKVYDERPNPTEEFCAIMVCSQADEACPSVNGTTNRISLPYDDPKVADGTAEETARYDERSAEIARDMLFVFSEATRKSR